MSKKVLVVRYSALGDLILTTGPLACLKSLHPSYNIDLLTSEVGQELFINSIDVDNTIVVPKGSGLGDLISIYSKLDRYDIIIDCQGNFKSYFLKLFLRGKFFRIKKQSKERRAFVKKRKFKEDLNKHVVQKYYDVLKEAFPDLPDRDLEELRPLFPPQKLSFAQDQFDMGKSVVLHPYASQKNKEWPHFKELADQLVDKKTPVVVIGHSSDPIDFKESPFLVDLTNKTSLREMAAVLGTAQAFVTTDSGPMHMGIAVKTPTLALFGPTTKEFGFYPEFDKTVVIEEDLECRPCHVHGGNSCPLEHHECMTKIQVTRVLEQLQNFL